MRFQSGSIFLMLVGAALIGCSDSDSDSTSGSSEGRFVACTDAAGQPDGTVSDLETGLLWEQKTGTFSVGLENAVDLRDETTRTIVVEVVNNAGFVNSGIYAGDPEATFGPLGDATYSVVAGVGTITISPCVWEAYLISEFGESLSPTEAGVVPGTTTENEMTIDIESGLPGPDYRWDAQARVDFPPFGIRETSVFGIYTNTAYLGDRFPGAPPNTDWWYQPGETGELVNSCREYRAGGLASVDPAVGQCDIADFRGDEAYNPGDGTFTFLGVASNQFVTQGFASPNYALLRYRISEVSGNRFFPDENDNCPSDDDPHDVNNLYRWSSSADGEDPDGSAFTDFLAKLNAPAAPFAGHSDWRLPELSELQSILIGLGVLFDEAKEGGIPDDPEAGTNPTGQATACDSVEPCVDPAFAAIGGPTAPSYYWSNVTAVPLYIERFDLTVPRLDQAYSAFFSVGKVNPGNKKNQAAFVRAVRTGSCSS